MLTKLKSEKQRLLDLYSEYLSLNGDKRVLEKMLDIEEELYPKKRDKSMKIHWAISTLLIVIQLSIPAELIILKAIMLLLIITNAGLFTYGLRKKEKSLDTARQRVLDNKVDIKNTYDAMLNSRELIFTLIDEAEQYQNSKEDFESILSAMMFLEKRSPSYNPRMKLLTNNPTYHVQS